MPIFLKTDSPLAAEAKEDEKESSEKTTMDTEGIEDTGVNVKSRLEAAMYVKGSEEATMEDLINTKDSSPHPPLLCTRHLLRLTSSTTVTPFTMSMFMFCKLLIQIFDISFKHNENNVENNNITDDKNEMSMPIMLTLM